MNKTLITIPEPSQVPTLAPEAIERRDLLLRQIEKLPAITDQVTCILAVSAAKEGKKAVKDVEASRKEVSAPFIAAQRAINAIAKEFSDTLEAAIAKTEKAVSTYQLEVERKAKAEEEMRQAAIRQAQKEAEEAARLAREKEVASFESSTDKAIQESIQADRAWNEAEEAARAAMLTPVTVAEKPSSVAFREETYFEVTDIAKLWASRPDLCNPPTPRASAIKSTIFPGLEVPGLRVWTEKRAVIRTV